MPGYLGDNFGFDGMEAFNIPMSPPHHGFGGGVDEMFPYDHRPAMRNQPRPPNMIDDPNLRASMMQVRGAAAMAPDPHLEPGLAPMREDPLYAQGFAEAVGLDQQGGKKKKSKKKGASGFPDPHYLMMLKMIDPDINLSSVIEHTLGIKPTGRKNGRDGDEENSIPTTTGRPGAETGRAIAQKDGNPYFEKLVENQTKMIETLMKEIRELKEQKADEDQIAVSKQIEKLEKMLEKKDQRAEQEEFQYQLKRDMAEYVRGLGEILAGQREEIKGPEDEIDAIMGKAEDKLGFMNKLAKQQAKLNKKRIAEMSEDEEEESTTSRAPTRRSRGAGSNKEENVPNPDQLMQMLMAQNQMGGNGPIMMPGGFGGAMGGMQLPGMMGMMGGMNKGSRNGVKGSQTNIGSKRSLKK